ncbi:MAG: hypothetical protein KatS3mg131_3682 [Candidatus Tectimicrobiota bacterium]|nr:MAG: hypothetical protein KatS3mg131_3682 [Candidatus Tectomicrobia bacterium]
MAWRLYDLLNCRWYNDDIYTSRKACVAAAARLMRQARAEGEVLELVAEPFDPSELPIEEEVEEEGA